MQVNILIHSILLGVSLGLPEPRSKETRQSNCALAYEWYEEVREVAVDLIRSHAAEAAIVRSGFKSSLRILNRKDGN